MKRILLVSPFSDNEGLWVTGEETAEVKNNFPPLGLATVAALTPREGFEVRIHDELVHGKIDSGTMFEEKIDLVGVTGYKAHLRRCKEIASIFRKRGILAAAGGPGVSGSPQDYREHFDILFINETELTWPRFLKDWNAGKIEREYRQIEKPDLSGSPMPRWDSIEADFKAYAMGTVQTTRGCPFDCEFCDVVFLFGRRPRHKPIERVLAEVKAMKGYGFMSVFFCDDEFSGDRKYAKELLRELVKLNSTFDEPLIFSSQMSIAISGDEELLGLLADANFDLVFVGIESPNDESLRSVNKVQNLRGDMVENIHRVLSYGIGIRAGMIVGFDDDGLDIFDRQHAFIQESCLTSVGINILKAPLGTRFWTRLMHEGRVVNMALNKGLGHSRTYTNIIPKGMSRVELLEGYGSLLERVYSWESFGERARGFVSLAAKRTAARLRRCKEAEERVVIERLRKAVPAEASDALERIIDHTLATAPHLLKKVRTLVLQHAKYRSTVGMLLPQLDKQIEREKSGDIILEPDNRAMPAPERFREAFDKLLPSVYTYVRSALKDKGLTTRALTGAFVEFLVRWGEDCDTIEDHHLAYLMDICERKCAGLNGTAHVGKVPAVPSEEDVREIKRLRLADDIFKNIWVELSELNVRKKDVEKKERAVRS